MTKKFQQMTSGGHSYRGRGQIINFLSWAVKFAFLDNPVTHGVQRVLDHVGRGTFIEQRAKFLSNVLWWFMLSSVALNVIYPDKEINTVKEKKFDGFKLNPLDKESWKNDVDGVHPYVLAHVISSEGFIKQAYDDNGGDGTLTLGSGFTINDITHRQFAQKILGRYVGNGAHITIDENRVLVSEWLKQKIYPKIQQNLRVPVDSRLFVILAVAAYNKGANIFAPGNSGRPVIDAINAGRDRDEINAAYVRAFAGIRGTQWGGLPNKYGLCALYHQGVINDTTIIESIAEAPYTLERHIRKNGGRLVTYEAKNRAARANGVYNPGDLDSLMKRTKYRVTKGCVQQPVRKYLTLVQCDVIDRGVLGKSGADFQDYIAKKAPEKLDESDELNIAGEELYFNKKYAAAIEKFKLAIDTKPHNYIAYSNLALSYYKMGRYADGLKVVQELIHSPYFAQMPNDIRGYTYFNVALCRMELGNGAQNASQSSEHYTKALANLNLAEKYSSRSYNTIKETLNKKIRPIDNKQAEKMRRATKVLKKASPSQRMPLGQTRDR